MRCRKTFLYLFGYRFILLIVDALNYSNPLFSLQFPRNLLHFLCKFHTAANCYNFNFAHLSQYKFSSGSVEFSLNRLYHVLRTWYPSGGIKRLAFCGKRRNQMRDGIMPALQTLYHVSCLFPTSFGVRVCVK